MKKIILIIIFSVQAVFGQQKFGYSVFQDTLRVLKSISFKPISLIATPSKVSIQAKDSFLYQYSGKQWHKWLSTNDISNIIDTVVEPTDSGIFITETRLLRERDSIRTEIHDTANRLRAEFDSTINYTIISAFVSPGGYHYKSLDNGQTWLNFGTMGKGDILSVIELYNGDLLGTTSYGWVCNFTKNINVFISYSPIRAIAQNFEDGIQLVMIGNDDGEIYSCVSAGDFSVDFLTWTLSEWSAGGAKINKINIDPPVIFTSAGIFHNYDLVQAGYFTNGLVVSPDTLYGIENNEHVWQSVNGGVSWTDLGDKNAKSFLLEGSGSRIIYDSNNTNISYTNNQFSSSTTISEVNLATICVVVCPLIPQFLIK